MIHSFWAQMKKWLSATNHSECKNLPPIHTNWLKLLPKRSLARVQHSQCKRLNMKKPRRTAKASLRLNGLNRYLPNQTLRPRTTSLWRVKNLRPKHNMKARRSLTHQGSHLIRNNWKCWRKYSKKTMNKNRGSERKKLKSAKWRWRESISRTKNAWTNCFKKGNSKQN